MHGGQCHKDVTQYLDATLKDGFSVKTFYQTEGEWGMITPWLSPWKERLESGEIK